MINKMSMTPAQEEIYRFMEDYTDKNGYPPSTREIAKALGFRSHSPISEHLYRMEKKGSVRRVPISARRHMWQVDPGWKTPEDD